MPRSLFFGLMLLLFATATACGGNAEPESLREGRSIYGDSCSVCHGNRGQGAVGPGLNAVLETWPSCDAHVEWVEVGSVGWSERYGESYGATDKPVQGGMPSHADILTLEQTRVVAAFERVEYGGQDADEALADCRVE